MKVALILIEVLHTARIWSPIKKICEDKRCKRYF